MYIIVIGKTDWAQAAVDAQKRAEAKEQAKVALKEEDAETPSAEVDGN